MGSILSKIFEDFDIYQTKSIDSSKEVTIVNFPMIPVYDHEPLSIIQPDFARGPWIAGGACLRWYQGQPVGESDIDVFCINAHQAKQVIERIKNYGRFHVKFESDNAVTLDHNNKADWNKRWTIQVITRRYFGSLQEVIDNFDITVCQIGTGGDQWILGENTARDIREKNLRFTEPLQADAMKRLTKYWTYGYRPVEGTIEAIQNNPNSRWEFNMEEDYQNAF